MNIKLLTCATHEYGPLVAITQKTKEEYAEKRGYNTALLCHWDALKIAWERANYWKIEIETCDWLFFTGADVAITNQDIEVENIINKSLGYDFIFAVDGCGLQSDSWLMRNCKESLDFLTKVCDLEGKCPNEQDAMQLVLSGEEDLPKFIESLPNPRKSNGAPASEEMVRFLQGKLNKSPLRCKIIPQREINAYPLSCYGGTGQEEESWQYGDFICHIPGKSLDFRINMFNGLLGVTC